MFSAHNLLIVQNCGTSVWFYKLPIPIPEPKKQRIGSIGVPSVFPLMECDTLVHFNVVVTTGRQFLGTW
jgi:hypothetical protein